MDQGWAALLGATVGVAGTVLASAITGWSARQQVRAQARAEHAHWRRQVRRDAYGAFLAPASEAQQALKTAGRAFVGEPDVEEIDRRLQQAQEQLALAQAAWANLAVEGPEPVEQAARSVYTTLKSMQTTLLALRDSPADAPDDGVRLVERHAVEVARLSERIGEFTAAARSALDDIGG
ncbi:hypothetical protein [Streptomyces sp. Tu 3180]|uniref:hypothetical protein n=1 Tax=Streptomyces sp. Tu 3180 TaxID=2682611 RepID=UPI00135CBC5A|nr:hypothetical protein [Streptomyces sp. Tu 3180]KAF3465612.1 hypothetical protein GL259_15595 [Streptomyces sp. Tu 3180]